MPRRPLFCHVCTDLLDQLTAATEAVASDGANAVGTTGTDEPHSAWQTRTQERSRYFELRARVQQHREEAHAHGSPYRCVPQAHR